MITLEPLALEVFEAIENIGGKPYIVGGSVRDSLLGLPDSHDIDIEVYHLTYQQLVDILSKFGQVKTFGKKFAICKLKELPDYDFALPRKERKTGTKHQDFDIIVDPELSKDKAILRRDFTMNALLYDYKTDQVIDLCDGKAAIEKREIQIVNPDTFIEDPLRVLRAAQFSARFNMTISKETNDLCKDMVKQGMLKELPVERIYQEYNKILLSDHPEVGFQFLKEIGALPDYLANLVDTKQRSDYHPEGSVFNHTMLVLKQAVQIRQYVDEPLYFMWACLLHDIGKYPTTTIDLHCPNHAYVGAEMIESIDLLYTKKLRYYVSKLVQYHMRIVYVMKKRDEVNYLFILKDLGKVASMNDLFWIAICDKMGRGYIEEEQIAYLKQYRQYLIEKYHDQPIAAIVNGNDIKEFQLDEKEFKEKLAFAYHKQLEGFSKKQILEMIQKGGK